MILAKVPTKAAPKAVKDYSNAWGASFCAMTHEQRLAHIQSQITLDKWLVLTEEQQEAARAAVAEDQRKAIEALEPPAKDPWFAPDTQAALEAAEQISESASLAEAEAALVGADL